MLGHHFSERIIIEQRRKRGMQDAGQEQKERSPAGRCDTP